MTRTQHRHVITLSIITASLVAFGGCDELTGGGEDGPTTTCSRSYDAQITAEDYGVACTSDSDCAQGECMMPGDDGNITNDVFGFCTRACDQALESIVI